MTSILWVICLLNKCKIIVNMNNPEMMKNASNIIVGMSDSKLHMYLAQMGMSGRNPLCLEVCVKICQI